MYKILFCFLTVSYNNRPNIITIICIIIICIIYKCIYLLFTFTCVNGIYYYYYYYYYYYCFAFVFMYAFFSFSTRALFVIGLWPVKFARK
jgi:hypothetical protein